nr:MAG TPA: hypothetical protein [Caudoviricetes sp.]
MTWRRQVEELGVQLVEQMKRHCNSTKGDNPT